MSFRMCVRSVCLALVSIALGSGAFGQHPRPTPQCLWFVLLPQSPISDMDHFEHNIKVLIPEALVGTAIQPMNMEFRRSEDQSVVGRIAYPYFSTSANYPRGVSRNSVELGDLPAELRGLPDGDYVVAINVNGYRASNVAQFTIDRSLDIEAVPVLQLVTLEPTPFHALPFLGVRVTGSFSPFATTTGSTKPPASTTGSLGLSHWAPFRYFDVYGATVIVDETKRVLNMLVTCGGDPELEPGMRWLQILDLSSNRTPEISPGADHSVGLVIAGYSAGPIAFNPSCELGRRWDDAQSKG